MSLRAMCFLLLKDEVLNSYEFLAENGTDTVMDKEQILTLAEMYDCDLKPTDVFHQPAVKYKPESAEFTLKSIG